jgi:hypothetical protein
MLTPVETIDVGASAVLMSAGSHDVVVLRPVWEPLSGRRVVADLHYFNWGISRN